MADKVVAAGVLSFGWEGRGERGVLGQEEAVCASQVPGGSWQQAGQ